MTVDEALALCAKERKVGTINLTAEERALKNEAREIKHQHMMASDEGYAKGYHRMYQRLCIGTGRIDLLNKHYGN
jgi:hypothetical protein